MVEEVEISASTDEQNVNGENVAQGKDVEPELGEIVADEDSSSAKPSGALTDQTCHPLEYSWTFSFDSVSGKSKQHTWGSSIRPIYTFSTVEDFWGLYNNIKRPQSLSVGTDFYCFKAKIEPKWEDPVCAKGGKWTTSFSRGKSDTAWLFTLLAMIGEQFDHGDEICGAVVNIRSKLEKVSLWTKNASDERAQVSIGKQWKEFLDYSESIGFIVHEDAKVLDRGAKNRYTV